MKKLLILSVPALALLAAGAPRASAWSHCKFGMGLNFERMGGGNSLFWGLARGDQPPPAFGGMGGAPGFGGLPVDGGYGPPVGIEEGIQTMPQPVPRIPAPTPVPNGGADNKPARLDASWLNDNFAPVGYYYLPPISYQYYPMQFIGDGQ